MRKNNNDVFKAKVVLEILRGERGKLATKKLTIPLILCMTTLKRNY